MLGSGDANVHILECHRRPRFLVGDMRAYAQWPKITLCLNRRDVGKEAGQELRQHKRESAARLIWQPGSLYLCASVIYPYRRARTPRLLTAARGPIAS
eukprot:7379602-Prymnesium_polylepis.2